MQASETLSGLSARIDAFMQSMQEKALVKQSRLTLVKSLQEFAEKTSELKEKLAELEAKASQDGISIETGTQQQALSELLIFLKRNLQFEQEKASRTTAFTEISEKGEVPETYSAVEEKAKKALLNLRYFAEKASVSLHAEKKAFTGSRQAQDVLQLLRLKDQELEALKKKHNSIMAQGLLARVEEQTTADIEEQLNKTAQSLEVASSEVQKISLENKGSIERLEKSQAVLEQKIRQLDELLSKFMSKSLETITMLKKERDFARKFALDLEHETTSLRQTYANELLGLQEHKMQLQKEMQQNFVQKTKGLETELKQKSEFLEHFKKLVEEKEAELRLLKEKHEHQKQVLHHYARHEQVKKRHRKK
ncbi:MAG: hypothetical protein QT12_C0012G0005 [archaeon GW2011_AR21]|uniref:Uncharacterized protein n=1 Tax=Candidatus Iainarchaeum sp. TaxID=3101447 RepID=A0A7J4JXX2_9ARCH|nr:MAG: hypothetical protein QT12_C0012G0005 [archaeon GW2011_AR21]HIH21529.1 hypothetical protein [Candidatus Diapherotrites archaeon]HIH32766.1 hypothetical protein [Candidatus Diapherotrites archaeon]